MKARNGILALLAVLALAGCSVDAAPTQPGTVPRLSAGGITTLGSGSKADGSTTTTTSDSTLAAERGITTIGSGN
jgi:ABC-type glycerol-3-phosphate transport system substrate-binding protein